MHPVPRRKILKLIWTIVMHIVHERKIFLGPVNFMHLLCGGVFVGRRFNLLLQL